MNKKLLVQILFYGSLWGILEATLGHVLHYIPATIAGAIMFPIAGGILYKAYDATKSKGALMYVGAVAAMIKSIDLLLPQFTIYKTINPMISILLESLVVVLVVRLLISENPVNKYTALPVASISWRVVFALWMFFLHTTTGLNVPYIKTLAATINFVVISGLLSGVMATGLVFVMDKVTLRLPKLSENRILTTCLFVIALITTYML